MGDLLFTVVNLCRKHDVEAEEALHAAIAKFFRRFRHIEKATAEEGRDLQENTVEDWGRLWKEAKR